MRPAAANLLSWPSSDKPDDTDRQREEPSMASRVAIVTAAGHGMGAAIARELSAQGYALALLSSSGGGGEARRGAWRVRVDRLGHRARRSEAPGGWNDGTSRAHPRGGEQHRPRPQGGAARSRRRGLARIAGHGAAQCGADGAAGHPGDARSGRRRDRQRLDILRVRAVARLPRVRARCGPGSGASPSSTPSATPRTTSA